VNGVLGKIASELDPGTQGSGLRPDQVERGNG
jgi:hypothetical protein